MADYADILVNAQVPLKDFVKELESLLAIRCECKSDAWEEWYVCYESPIWLSIGEHDHESHGGLNFEDYRYDIQMGGLVMRKGAKILHALCSRSSRKRNSIRSC